MGSCDYSLTSVHLTEVLSLWLGHSINDQSSGRGLWENGHSLPRGSLEDQVRQLQNPGPDLPPVTLDHVLVSLNHWESQQVLALKFILPSHWGLEQSLVKFLLNAFWIKQKKVPYELYVLNQNNLQVTNKSHATYFN